MLTIINYDDTIVFVKRKHSRFSPYGNKLSRVIIKDLTGVIPVGYIVIGTAIAVPIMLCF